MSKNTSVSVIVRFFRRRDNIKKLNCMSKACGHFAFLNFSQYPFMLHLKVIHTAGKIIFSGIFQLVNVYLKLKNEDEK